ncbi:hypothetical protein DH2020_046794 [Rehmannia glutinosa]|uniref:B-like cyclin n=1 Tax=Rehmannia glutinosa TaxID=99300 RepID=A0ABR0UAF7_REHGL
MGQAVGSFLLPENFMLLPPQAAALGAYVLQSLHIQAVMNDENRSSNLREPTVRITRARAKALSSSSGLPPLYPSSKPDGKQVLRANLKRAASDDNKQAATSAACPQHKKRAVLKDLTNITCENLYINCINAARDRTEKTPYRRKGKVAPACFSNNSKVPGDRRENIMDEMNKVEVEKLQDSSAVNLTIEPTKIVDAKFRVQQVDHAEDGTLCVKQESLDDRGITDIDSKHKDPQMCSMYAADIYSTLYARQVDRRPLADYMEKYSETSPRACGALASYCHQDTVSLFPVSEEYRLVPDTLYLTVNLIDRFLSENYIEKQKLQLLGVTCMLIASKYEEICAPRVEEFCFITDNTYTKEEVVKMESCVLNLLGFQLSVPTTKKFLRRFIQAAQVSYKFLPSLIAASAVFLAKWTLDQSEHPWNPTLEYYTRHKTSELRSTILELQDLQLSTSGYMPNAIREKYKQSKFKCVSTLRSPKPVQSLF